MKHIEILLIVYPKNNASLQRLVFLLVTNSYYSQHVTMRIP